MAQRRRKCSDPTIPSLTPTPDIYIYGSLAPGRSGDARVGPPLPPGPGLGRSGAGLGVRHRSSRDISSPFSFGLSPSQRPRKTRLQGNCIFPGSQRRGEARPLHEYLIDLSRASLHRASLKNGRWHLGL